LELVLAESIVFHKGNIGCATAPPLWGVYRIPCPGGFWQTPKLLPPAQPWEFIKIGNCGSPVETEAGWLVLSHGVGAIRQYCLGAFLLDRDDPSRVRGRLREPLLSPNEAEREGYVPNVAYTCGALLHGRELIIPCAMSDSTTSFATVSLDELPAAME
jgi:predicted GH43/DUF377 family glycosyl hydrolase